MRTGDFCLRDKFHLRFVILPDLSNMLPAWSCVRAGYPHDDQAGSLNYAYDH